jgi:hypothetical protein
MVSTPASLISKKSRELSPDARAAINSGVSAAGLSVAWVAAAITVPLAGAGTPDGKTLTVFWKGWIVFWNEALGDGAWVLPSLLAVAVGLYAALFGESLLRQSSTMSETARIRVGFAGTLIASVALFYVLVALVVAANVVDSAKSVGVVIVGVSIYLLGIGVGTFSFGSRDWRLKRAIEDRRRSNFNVLWVNRLFPSTMTSKVGTALTLIWVSAPVIIAGLVGLVFLFIRSDGTVLVDVIAAAIFLTIASGAVAGATLVILGLWGTVPSVLVGVSTLLFLSVPALIEVAGTALVFNRDPAVYLLGWLVAIGVPAIGAVWLVPIFAPRRRCLMWTAGALATVVARKSAAQTLLRAEKTVARIQREQS